MAKDNLEGLGNTRTTRRAVLKGLLTGLGAGVLVQAAGGVTASAQAPAQQDQPKAEKIKNDKTKTEHTKIEKDKTEQGKEAKGKGNEKKKTEQPKQQHKK